jgi:hypothetical protein
MAMDGAIEGDVTGDDRNDCGGVNSGAGEHADVASSSSEMSGRVGGGDDGSDAEAALVGDAQWMGDVWSDGGDDTQSARSSVWSEEMEIWCGVVVTEEPSDARLLFLSNKRV